MALLEIKGLSKYFGGLRALDDVTLSVAEGEVFSVVGPNGSGKTTLFNVISGIYAPTKGSVRFGDRDLTGAAPHRVAQAGIGRTFQNVSLFPKMSVQDNVLLAMHSRRRENLAAGIARTAAWNREERACIRRARELLCFVELGGREGEAARNLPYGEQKRLEIARALALEPKCLLLDEPAAGTNPSELEVLTEVIARIRDLKVTIMLIEHRMDMVMTISDRVHVLNQGRTIAWGTPAEVCSNPEVIEAYLGKGASTGAAG
ncbi:MAG: ABC transporter ATP-binding protein [Firmicutes bacterium]|jgi:branched-chain amino acid transport system ATP-binding protein|nr:ABC transporter ATP-binding protein [Bacillota bacterium]